MPVTYENKRISHILKILIRKYRSRLWNTIFAMTPFDGKCQNQQTSFFTIFFIFAKVQPGRKKVTDTRTNRQTDRQTDTYTETDKHIAIGEILQIWVKMQINPLLTNLI